MYKIKWPRRKKPLKTFLATEVKEILLNLEKREGSLSLEFKKGIIYLQAKEADTAFAVRKQHAHLQECGINAYVTFLMPIRP